MDVITEFDPNIRVGLTIAVNSRVTFNNKHLQNFDKQNIISSGLFLDVSAMYETIINEKLPVGGETKSFYEDFFLLSLSMQNVYQFSNLEI